MALKKNKSSKDIKSPYSENMLTIYCHFIYRYIGRTLIAKRSFNNFFKQKIYNRRYEDILKKANLKLMPDEYFVTIYLTLLIGVLFIIFFSFIFLFIKPLLSASIFFVGVIGACFLGIFMYNYPILISNKRGTEIDAAMPYLLPYMKLLAKEISIAKIIEIIDDFLIYKELKTEFRKIKYYSNFLGYDIHSSIREAMQSCPSRQLSDLMNDLVTISNSGGNIYGYLSRKLDNMNVEIEALEKKNIDTLLIYSQIYIVILLIAPLFFTVMNAVLNLINFSSDAGGASGSSDFMLILYMLMGLPFAYVGFMMLVFYSKPLYSRLKPEED